MPSPESAVLCSTSLNGLRAHIPAGEERRALEEVREMAKVFGDTVCKELDLQRPRSDLQRAEGR